MVDFAFGGVGLNPHFGTPKCVFDRANGGRVPGGSSSGAGVAVADGMCVMSLVSDTRGSVRIPCAMNGITGFKPTQSRIPLSGAFPLSYSLDSVGPLANSVSCCAIFDSILAGQECSKIRAPLPIPVRGLRLLVPKCSLFEDLDSTVATCFERSLQTLEQAGACIERRDMPILTSAQDLFANGGLAGAEAYQVHRGLLAKHSNEYDPRVSSRVALGETFSAADYIQIGIDRRKLIQEVSLVIKQYDAFVFPTVAVTPPSIAEVSTSDADYVRWNLKMLRNPGLINLLDGCCVTVPCHSSGEAPVGFSIAGMAGCDEHILAVGRTVEDTLPARMSTFVDAEPDTKKPRTSAL